jgi:hypothetical protein
MGANGAHGRHGGVGLPPVADRKAAAVADRVPHRVVVFCDGGVDWVALCETAGCSWVRVGFYRQFDAEVSAAQHAADSVEQEGHDEP